MIFVAHSGLALAQCGTTTFTNTIPAGTYTSSGNYFVTGTLSGSIREVTISGDVTFNNTTVFMDNGVRIIVQNGASLTVNATSSHTTLTSCGTHSWDGIRVEYGAKVEQNGSGTTNYRVRVRHAERAVDIRQMSGTASGILIDQTDFANCRVGVYYDQNYNAGLTGNPDVVITRSSFRYDSSLPYYVSEDASGVYATGRPDYGIWIRQVNNNSVPAVTIGSTDTNLERNEFSGLDFGIGVVRSNVNVYRCSFHDLTANTNSNGSFVTTANQQVGTGIYVSNLNENDRTTSLHIGDENLTSGHCNLFENITGCGIQLHAIPSHSTSYAADITVAKNSFTSVRLPVYGIAVRDSRFAMVDNYARNFLDAVWFRNTIFQMHNAGIDNNVFENQSTDAFYLAPETYGIRYQPSEAGTEVSVTNNVIKGVYRGIFIQTSDIAAMENNEIQYGYTTSLPAFHPLGIYVGSGEPAGVNTHFFTNNNEIDCIEPVPSGVTSRFNTGIMIESSTAPWVHGNDVSLGTRGIWMHNANNGMNITCNEISSSTHDGVRIEGFNPTTTHDIARILGGGSNNDEPSDNQWHTITGANGKHVQLVSSLTGGNGINWHYRDTTCTSCGAFSPFPYVANLLFVPQQNLSPTTNAFTCNPTAPNTRLEELDLAVQRERLISGYKQFDQKRYPQTDYRQTQKLNDMWFAYHVLHANPEMLNAGTEYDTDYQLVYNEIERSDAATATKIDDAFRQYDYATAAALNASLSNTTAWSRNLKYTNAISLQYPILPEEGFPEEVVKNLETLAYQSSLVVGPAAFRARGLLGLAITDPEYRADDEPEMLLATAMNKTYVVVTPNPSDGRISIGRLTNGTGDYTIDVYNALGQLMHQSIIGSNTYRAEFNLTEMPSGIYLYKVSTGGASLQSGKLVIR